MDKTSSCHTLQANPFMHKHPTPQSTQWQNYLLPHPANSNSPTPDTNGVIWSGENLLQEPCTSPASLIGCSLKSVGEMRENDMDCTGCKFSLVFPTWTDYLSAYYPGWSKFKESIIRRVVVRYVWSHDEGGIVWRYWYVHWECTYNMYKVPSNTKRKLANAQIFVKVEENKRCMMMYDAHKI